MGDIGKSWFGTALKILVTGFLVCRGFFIFITVKGVWGAVPSLLEAMACFGFAGLIVTPTIAEILASPWGRFVYYPKKRLRKSSRSRKCRRAARPSAMSSSMARMSEMDALAAVEPYAEMIRMTVEEMGNEELGKDMLDDALTLFPQTSCQITLRAAFFEARGTLSDLKSDDEQDG
jgi:hypothetical protein